MENDHDFSFKRFIIALLAAVIFALIAAYVW